MALYTISDLHLPIGIDKPMDIFGSKWTNYVQRLEKNWKAIINDDDTVVIPGDISWATYLEQSIPDFDFIESLPGRKIIMKGNHDYWWTTMSKLNKFLADNNYKTISFMQNNSFMYKDVAICGTRGWNYIGYGTATDEDIRIYEREVGRFLLSLDEAKKSNPEKIIAFFHYPPICADCMDNGFTEVMKNNGIELCIYGHIHSAGHKNAVEGVRDGIKYMLVSCDYRDFIPVKLCD
ncbi:MAG: metallophosphoesterase [Clostridia bacterium]|nr:metallophosphoesterase [Clostridia bacterium]